MATDLELKCDRCAAQSCKLEPGEKPPPEFCPAPRSEQLLAEVAELYLKDPAVAGFSLEAARTEAAGYCRDTRVEETMAFARRLHATHLGIACCVGTQREARMAQEIFEANGFRVSTVACKVGSIPKESVGLQDEEKIHPGQFEALCNPIGQARLLAEVGTELNVVIGLCVGHDSLFFRHSSAPVTVLVVKDRVLGHNPVAALYTSRSYYRSLRQPSRRDGSTD